MGVIKEERDGLDSVLRRYMATGTIDALLAEPGVQMRAIVERADGVKGRCSTPTAVGPVWRSRAE
jgi:glucose-6-phosphate isomerase